MWKKMLWVTALGVGVFIAYKNKECIMQFTEDMYNKISNNAQDMQDEM